MVRAAKILYQRQLLGDADIAWVTIGLNAVSAAVEQG